MNKPIHVLVLGYVWPEPNSSAAGKHMLSLLNTFQQAGWHITFASPAVQGDHKIDLTAMGISEHTIALNCSSFDVFIQQLQPDIVLFDRFMLEEQFGWRVAQHCPNALRILDTEDLHSLRNARHQALKQERELNTTDFNSELAKREVAAIFRCDLALIISDFEYRLLQEHYQVPARLLLHLPFMLALSHLTENVLPYDQRQHFICMGNFRHEPNWDAVLWLKNTIWPLIRKNLPQAELHVYGAYPPPKATQLHNIKQGFLIKGWAQDAEQVMKHAKVCLAPLRFGAGIKGKLSEAMLCGTPSVTTTIGTEGMGHASQKTINPLGLQWPGASIDFDVARQDKTARAFAEAAVALFQDQKRWQACQRLGFSWLEQHFDQRQISPSLLARINELLLNLNKHRGHNFIGQMLQHHQFKSTQYMAQWIEAKNKPR
ncbi:glycosyltransferase family 4 protein [Paraglaciecola sp.]|uniref:glycosyltransferase family 4 protein n=1 Tax=Paraglaciecola sp. TaxID=1920173 RepID=UPI00273D2491|nr:glycosyltransferase family 4 protein [Paraglaciecola sp.]MDP5032127.1 glycosyltransferase family 4 protein [Paraglaciecola sp.]